MTRIIALSIALFASSPLVLAQADESPETTEPFERRLPRTLIDSSRQTATVLLWRNGERANGKPVGADAEHFSWKTPIFEEPMPLLHTAVERVDFSGSSKPTDESFRFAFTDGSHLTGELQAINAGNVTLTSSSCGDAIVRLDQLAAIERISGPGIIAAGAASFLSADSTAKGRFGHSPAFISTAGEVVFLEFNGGINQALDLPEKCLVKLRLRIEREPTFSLELSTGKKSISLETWDDELVLTEGGSFASAGIVELNDDGQLEVQLGWDRAAGTCALYDKLGKPLATLNIEEVEEEPAKPRRKTSFLGSLPLIGGKLQQLLGEAPEVVAQAQPEAAKGVTLTNQGAGFVVEFYQLSEWSGEPPQAMPLDGDGVETAGEFIAGKPVACDGKTIKVQTAQGEREIPLDDVRALRWARAPMVGPELPQSALWYSNGNLVRGTLLGIADGNASIKTSFADAPLPASLEKSRALVFAKASNPAGEEEPELEEMDTISTGDVILHGTIHPAGGVLPAFLPVGSSTPLQPVAQRDLIIRRQLTADAEHRRAPALLNTRSDEALPVTVDRFDADKISFHWDAAEVTEMPTAEIHAVQFPLPSMRMDLGFDSGGWKFLGKRKATNKRTKVGGITLEPGTSIGHPYIAHGEDFGFNFKKGDSGNTSFRIRLFCQGTRDKSGSINFLIAHYGSIYAGLERDDSGQFASNRTDLPDSGEESDRVDFKFKGNSVEMRINDQVVGKTTIKKKDGKLGTGLVIEPTALWGNSFGAVTVSGFSTRGSPIGVGAPGFSDDAKREALLLPRLRRDVPPRHILIGRNGDLLRGEIEGKSGADLQFRVGLENYKVPIERIAAAIWVEEADKAVENIKEKPAIEKPEPEVEKKPEVTKAEKEGEETEKEQPEKPLEKHSEQWLELTNGGRLLLDVEAWTPENVTGTHKLLGRCTIPTGIVHQVSLKKPELNSNLAALSGWKFEHTIDPNPPGQDEADVSPLVGKPAPDFDVKMLEGEEFKLSKAKGKVVVLDFWATWCAPCVRSLPHVITAMAEFPADKVAFIAVNQGEAKKQVEQFMDIRGFKMPVGFDPEMKTGDLFGVESIPFTVVIDKAGTVTYVSLGASPDGAQKLSDAVAKALSAADPE